VMAAWLSSTKKVAAVQLACRWMDVTQAFDCTHLGFAVPTTRKILLQNFVVYKRDIARYCSEASKACIEGIL
jgi:hypothetical protein